MLPSRAMLMRGGRDPDRLSLGVACIYVISLLCFVSLAVQWEAQRSGRGLWAWPTSNNLGAPQQRQLLAAPPAATSLAAAAAAPARGQQQQVIDISMFAGVAPGVPRDYPTRARPLPEEQAAQTCAFFYQRYAAMHNLTLAQPEGSPLRRLAVSTYPVMSGIGDVFTGLIGTFLWSVIEDRAYQLYWPESEQVLHSPFINLTYTGPSAAVTRPGYKAGTNVSQFTELEAVQWRAGRDLFRALRNGSWSSHFSHPIEVIETNCGLARWLYGRGFPEWSGLPAEMHQWQPPPWMRARLQQMGLPDYRTAYACASNFLLQLREEHRAPLAPLANLLTSKRSLSICIHYRAGDQYLQNRTRAAAELERVMALSELYFDCAEQVERQHLRPGQQPVWYLSTDHEHLRQAMRAKFPHKLAYFPTPPRRSYTPHHTPSLSADASCMADPSCRQREAVSSLAATMQEWYLLSLCDYIVMDGGSGFSATALGRTFRNDSAYILGHDPGAAYYLNAKLPRRGANRTQPICARPSNPDIYGTNNAAW